jgi:uncharacterized protein (DUF1778 family)
MLVLHYARMENHMNKPRVPVTLTEEQHKTLLTAAEAVGLTISAYIRMAALERAAGGGDDG